MCMYVCVCVMTEFEIFRGYTVDVVGKFDEELIEEEFSSSKKEYSSRILSNNTSTLIPPPPHLKETYEQLKSSHYIITLPSPTLKEVHENMKQKYLKDGCLLSKDNTPDESNWRKTIMRYGYCRKEK